MRSTFVATLVAVVLFTGCIFCRAAFPPNISVPDVGAGDLERGRYLVHNVSSCFTCHGERQWQYFSAPTSETTLGSVGEVFVEGKVRVQAPNISPTVLKDWSDGEIVRAIANGVSRDGGALFPIMPYNHYSKASKADLAAMVAYLRTIAPQSKVEVAARELPGPLPFLVRAFVVEDEPRDTTPVLGETDYGEYLTELASCQSCHTPMKGGRFVVGMEFAGGREFKLPTGGLIRSPNLTPDDSGLKGYSKEAFIARFQAMIPENLLQQELPPGSMNTVMPWADYSGMNEDDLGAIYDYLRTLQPIENRVLRFEPEG